MIMMIAAALAAAAPATPANPAPPAEHQHQGMPQGHHCCCDDMARGDHKMDCGEMHGDGHGAEHSGHGTGR
ncbi:MAG: hypothetical protein ABIO69_05920 [Sphingomicrobium sp.]